MIFWERKKSKGGNFSDGSGRVRGNSPALIGGGSRHEKGFCMELTATEGGKNLGLNTRKL